MYIIAVEGIDVYYSCCFVIASPSLIFYATCMQYTCSKG